MAESTNRVHVSPGVYTSETVDMKTAAKSLGVTKLAVVGETLKGPAFEPYWISSQKEFASVFGSTSTAKFKGSNYLKYELPYIANEYLSKSNELCVVRTLGFSGYNAGPAWLVTGEKSTSTTQQKYVIAVLRSRGTYAYRAEYAKMSDGGCTCQSAYDSLTYDVGELKTVSSCSAPKSYNMSAVSLSEYMTLNSEGTQCTSYSLSGTAAGYSASYGDLGRFTINCIVGPSNDGDTPESDSSSALTVVHIPVSLNPTDKDYILKVLGSSNDDGTQPLYVESLYDVAWQDLVVSEGFNTICSGLTTYNVGYAADYCGLDSVSSILTKYQAELAKKDVGKRYLYATTVTDGSPSGITYYVFDYKTNSPKKNESGITVTAIEASASTTTIEDGEGFTVSDGDYAGTYVNISGIDHTIKEIYASITSGDGTIAVEKVNSLLSQYVVKKCEEGHIYTVTRLTDSNGTKHYVYRAYDETQTSALTDQDEKITAQDKLLPKEETTSAYRRGSIVYNYEDGLYYKVEDTYTVLQTATLPYEGTGQTSEFTATYDGIALVENGLTLLDYTTLKEVSKSYDGYYIVNKGGKYCVESKGSAVVNIVKSQKGKPAITGLTTVPVTCDVNNYKTAFRYSSTPWVVSNAKGDVDHIELNRMFRFHTISDGSNSVDEVKVSIENIRPDTGQFDVVVRSYYDTDSSTSVLERFSKCTMEKGKKFIGYMIGTIDGQYESKSKYITVEVADTTGAMTSVPAGFLGYSIPLYGGATIAGDEHTDVSIAPIKYNTTYDEDVTKKRQYFGISDRTGYDYDYFSFKGNMSVLEDPDFMSKGFHLDCRLDASSYASTDTPTITVDGVEGYEFDTVSVNARTSSLADSPIIGTEEEMSECIYEDIKLRKFTLVFAGGFDGWDPYRDQRTNTDEFAYSSYKGYISKGNGIGYAFDNFDTFNDSLSYNIEGGAITSDYYSELAALSLLKNPEEVDINLLATPGIDTMNNTKLVNEVFNLLEDRADTFYIVTTPDKESGSGDYADEIPDVDSVVSDFEDNELHSDYAATYYPWIKIEDDGEYVWMPPTRDVLRNMAESDNSNTTMNLAPAGLTRGKVDAIRARKNLKLAECDTLYDANINPVRTYAQEGVVVMGQKTLRESDDLLNRIDVRRCVLRMRKLIAIGTLGLIFEPNDNSTVQSFKTIVSGIMEGFVSNRAISNWKMDVDDSEEARDRLEIPATIYIKPIRALEYISINFVVTNNGSYFED